MSPFEGRLLLGYNGSMANPQANNTRRFRWQAVALAVVLLASFGLYLALGSGLVWLAALMFALLALAYVLTIVTG